MSTTVINTNVPLAYGAGLTYRKFSIDYTTIIAILGAGVTSGDIPLFTLPRGGKLLGFMVKHSIQFAGVGGTFKVSIGKAGSAVFFTPATVDLVATAVADNTLQETALFKSGQITAVPVVMNVVSSVGNLTTLTAGQVDVYVASIEPSTPNL